LLAGGQGVFGIAVSGALRELSGELAELPAERVDGAPMHSADDELSMRRRPRAAVCPVALRPPTAASCRTPAALSPARPFSGTPPGPRSSGHRADPSAPR